MVQTLSPITRAAPRALVLAAAAGAGVLVAAAGALWVFYGSAVFYGGEACKASGGVVVWIDNSLDDTLSPETMISIAKSLVLARRAPA